MDRLGQPAPSEVKWQTAAPSPGAGASATGGAVPDANGLLTTPRQNRLQQAFTDVGGAFSAARERFNTIDNPLAVRHLMHIEQEQAEETSEAPVVKGSYTATVGSETVKVEETIVRSDQRASLRKGVTQQLASDRAALTRIDSEIRTLKVYAKALPADPDGAHVQGAPAKPLPPTPAVVEKVAAALEHKAELEVRIKYSQGQLQALAKHGDSWFGSNYFRDHAKEGIAALDHGGKVSPAEYQKVMDSSVAGLVNAQTQKGEDSTAVRSGGIADLRNLHTNLGELKAIVAGTVQLADVRKRLEGELSKHKPGSPAHSSIACALKQLENMGTVKAAIAERRACLNQQYLQLLALHAEGKSPQELQEMEHFKVGQLGLLSPSKDRTWSDSGWRQNEGSIIADMSEIFTENSGKVVHFDGKGPYIDEKGEIHLPAKAMDPSHTATLQSRFVNASIQGNVKNTGAQKAANDSGLAGLKGEITSDNTAAHALLDDANKNLNPKRGTGKSSTRTALNLARTLKAAGYEVGINCLSGKDRTGLVAALFTAAETVAARLKGAMNSVVDKFLSQLAPKMISGAGLEVVQQNTPEAEFLKLGPGAHLSAKDALGQIGDYVMAGLRPSSKRVSTVFGLAHAGVGSIDSSPSSSPKVSRVLGRSPGNSSPKLFEEGVRV